MVWLYTQVLTIWLNRNVISINIPINVIPINIPIAYYRANRYSVLTLAVGSSL